MRSVVGPGTGSVTRRIAARLGPEDRLDLVELNETFVQRLRHRAVGLRAPVPVELPHPAHFLDLVEVQRRGDEFVLVL